MRLSVYARTHTQTTWVLDVSPGVGRTPGEPEESRSTKAQYTCRPYRCTKYICLYISHVGICEQFLCTSSSASLYAAHVRTLEAIGDHFQTPPLALSIPFLLEHFFAWRYQ